MLTLLLVLNILMRTQTWPFPLISLLCFPLFSLLASLAAARPGKVQTLLQSLFLLLLLLLLWFLLLLLIVVLLLQLLLPLHVMLVVFVFLFFVIHNADASSTDIDPHASGRSPQTSRICSVHGATRRPRSHGSRSRRLKSAARASHAARQNLRSLLQAAAAG